MSSDSGPAYRVPALEKGLDILEHLAFHGVPMTQAQLARALGRGSSELFRMLACLEQRGYLTREPISGAYSLTLRLYELSRAHSPFEGLIRAAARPMRELTEEVHESCHLSILQRRQLMVLAQEESTSRLRLSVEVGGMFAPLHTASGRLLLAYAEPAELTEVIDQDAEYSQGDDSMIAGLHERLALIRERGYEVAYGETVEGVSDLAVLVGTAHSVIRAALVIPSLTRRRDRLIETMLSPLRRYAEMIARAAGIGEF